MESWAICVLCMSKSNRNYYNMRDIQPPRSKINRNFYCYLFLVVVCSGPSNVENFTTACLLLLCIFFRRPLETIAAGSRCLCHARHQHWRGLSGRSFSPAKTPYYQILTGLGRQPFSLGCCWGLTFMFGVPHISMTMTTHMPGNCKISVRNGPKVFCTPTPPSHMDGNNFCHLHLRTMY